MYFVNDQHHSYLIAAAVESVYERESCRAWICVTCKSHGGPADPKSTLLVRPVLHMYTFGCKIILLSCGWVWVHNVEYTSGCPAL